MARIETMTVHNVRVTVPDEIMRQWEQPILLDDEITPAEIYKTVVKVMELDAWFRQVEARQRRRSRIAALRSSVAVLP